MHPIEYQIYRFLLFPTLLMTMWGPLGSWQFPYLLSQSGSACAFLFIFISLLVVYGGPMITAEIAMGSYLKGPVKMFRAVPITRAMGVATTGYIFLLLPHYATLCSYAIAYFHTSVTDFPTAFQSCDNIWNTPNCTVPKIADFANEEAEIALLNSVGNLTDPLPLAAVPRSSPAEEYYTRSFQYFALEDHFHDQLDGLDPTKALSLLIFCLLLVPFFFRVPISIGVLGSVGLVASIALLGVISAVAFSLPGAAEGVKQGFSGVSNVTFAATLGNFNVAYDVVNFLIFTIPLGIGVLPTLTHYKRVNNFGIDVPGLLLGYLGILLWNAAVVWALVGFVAHRDGVEAVDLIRKGPELSFIVLPRAFAALPGGQHLALVYFAHLVLVALTSAAPMVEVVSSAAYAILEYSNYKMAKGHATVTRFIVGLCVLGYTFIFGLIYCTKQGGSVLGLVDLTLMYLICFVIACQLLLLGAFFLIKVFVYGSKTRVPLASRRQQILVAGAVAVGILVLVNIAHGCHMVTRFIADYHKMAPMIAEVPHRWLIGAAPLAGFAVGTFCCVIYMMRRALQFGVPVSSALFLPYGSTEAEIYQLAAKYRKASSAVYRIDQRQKLLPKAQK